VPQSFVCNHRGPQHVTRAGFLGTPELPLAGWGKGKGCRGVLSDREIVRSDWLSLGAASSTYCAHSS
jgi:hypothetical protein